jgi:protein SCO1/2
MTRMKLMRPGLCAAAAMLLVCALSCARGRSYEMVGQILAVDAARREITIKHDDIRGFMPAMTMTFKVRDGKMLEGRTAGELIRATLVVTDTEAYLQSIQATGRAPLTEAAPAPLRVDPMDPGDEVPDVSLLDQNGQPRKLSEWRGRAVAVTFIYTRCPLPDFCPLMDRQFADVQRQVKEDPQLRGRVHLLSISFDPSYDTPAVLLAHAKALKADPSSWTFLTGATTDIEAFAGRFGVAVMRDKSAPTEVVHNLRTGVIDPRGRLVKILNGIQWQPSELVAELRNAVGR